MEELLEEALLVIHVQNSISAVHHVVKAVRVLHRCGVLHMKLDPMSHSRAHLVSPLIGDVNHVLAQVDAIHQQPVLAGSVEGRSSDATADIQHLHATLMQEYLAKFMLDVCLITYLQIKLIE